MSVFGKMFGGGKKAAAAPSPQEAIQKLRETEEMLMKKQEFLETKVRSVLLLTGTPAILLCRALPHQ